MANSDPLIGVAAGRLELRRATREQSEAEAALKTLEAGAPLATVPVQPSNPSPAYGELVTSIDLANGSAIRKAALLHDEAAAVAAVQAAEKAQRNLVIAMTLIGIVLALALFVALGA